MKLFKVDAFTDKPFGGNPAAVCLLAQSKSEAWMQSIAQEMNLAETAFIYPVIDGGYNLRWFTPTVEVDLCGHATLATAHVLWEISYLTAHEEVRFHTKSGLLTAKRKENWIELNFPAEPAQEAEVPAGLVEALKVKPLFVGKNRFDYIVEVESEEVVRNLQPDLKLLATVPARGIIVTSASADPAYDFVSRFFGPASGIDEDPVTGSAHCCLGPYWQQKLNKNTFTAFQASKRGGIVKVKVSDDRVFLTGQAVIILRGELVV
ncbi:PhzF family phenazine biosynthesis protein [Rhodocytophaga rosea]|uniref:PhzF family phenazine biosynthesis protein n=1 Tax=Rhodocytophaga rosea TaxID=2704465 RepID=A0A6C0GGH3_9BACT|nr:PhzF family phenazine biosynthesis protein [Rhodocytophaga rosea]QHT66883.1 PhzF family phenazine biosynthesis protein [Rhodocytophaga rosea]